jgi:hypothetical protein
MEQEMTGRADFTPEEWALVLEGPTSAGMVREDFSSSSKGARGSASAPGTFR